MMIILFVLNSNIIINVEVIAYNSDSYRIYFSSKKIQVSYFELH